MRKRKEEQEMSKRRRRRSNPLKLEAQTLFWKYALGPPLASAAASAAYKASFMDFLEYAAGRYKIRKLKQIRKRHLKSYIRYLKNSHFSELSICKWVYGICFWFAVFDPAGMRMPRFDAFCEEDPALSNARVHKI